MDGIHIHLLLNHSPIIGTFIGLVLLAWGMLKGQETVKQTGLMILVLTGLVGIPVHISGESAEQAIRHLDDIELSNILMEEHEHWGGYAFMAGNVTLLISLIAWGLGRVSQNTKVITTIALVAALITFAIMVKTGNTGGQIRHPEIWG